jgi:hypothetical protein
MILVAASGWRMGLVRAAQADDESKPKVSKEQLSDERVAVYHDFLVNWMGKEIGNVNLAIQTMPLDKDWAGDPEGCRKGLELEAVTAGETHYFRAVDGWKIGGEKLRLVVAETQEEEIKKQSDPGMGIRKGQSVEEAVDNGFRNGLFTFSEIQFDKKHEHAILKFSFHCGMLCGHGGTVVLTKKDGVWKQTSECGNWIS